MSFSIHTLYHSFFGLWRKQRFRAFLNIIHPTKDEVLLDVGGYPTFWTASPPIVKRIDCLNINPVAWGGQTQPCIRTFVGDGCSLPMPDNSYEIGFSNSVIEHVGSWERQKQFAAEIRRVSDALWVQTPAYECPIEPHYLAPFIHYLPRALQKSLVRWVTPWGWLESPDRKRLDEVVDSTRLIRKAEMRELFPDCIILTERLLWLLPKSYIAIRQRG